MSDENQENNTNISEETDVSKHGRIQFQLIEDEMKKSYIDYAMSVIVGRALPDVRDGLKPVHRRILYAMFDMGILSNKAYKKSARIVGEVLGKYHPHGDSAVYDAMVRMVQDFSLRYPLVNGQGNFGSMDGDGAAAMRYTEARLTKISEEFLDDIKKETVDFRPNFDESLQEPTVLPTKIPNLLVNGSSGIAVGMATNIPPHNITEIINATIALIDNSDLEVADLMEYVPGPDFPTGGIICGRSGIQQAFLTGRGSVKIKSKTRVEEHKKRNRIIVTEIPYMVNKSMLIEQIAHAVRDKAVEGVSDLRDESDREGVRIVIELKMDANSEVVLNQLFKHTRLQTSFGINTLSLVENEPLTLNLKEMIVEFIKHRYTVVERRAQFDLKKAQERAHILEGLIKALDHIDEIINKIKNSRDVEFARSVLMGDYGLSEPQAKAILDMRLQKLAAMEQEKIRSEHNELMVKIKELQELLASSQKIYDVIKTELLDIKSKYGDSRKTEIIDDEGDYDIESLIKQEDMVVSISHEGYIKRISPDTYRQQRRGGKGVVGQTTKEEDWVEHLFIANTHATILFFTDKGMVHWLKVYKIPEGSRQAKGKPIINLIDIEKDERVTSFIVIREFEEGKYLLMATKNGIVKKTDLVAYSRPRAGGIIALTLDEGDKLINTLLTDGNEQVLLATKSGMAVKFNEQDARPIGRTSRGVRGITLREDDEVVSLIRAPDHLTALTITENGYGKRTTIDQYRLINRGGKGVINIMCSERNGNVVSVKSVEDDDEVMLISQQGIIIRTPVEGIAKIGRNTQGVRIMKMSESDKVVSVAKIAHEDEEPTEGSAVENEEEVVEEITDSDK